MSRELSLTGGAKAIVDEEDYLELAGVRWYAYKHKCGKIYAWRWLTQVKGARVMVYMHRQIVGAPRGEEVDHRDGNSLNNCRGNLRICSRAQNGANTRKQNRTCSSRFKGVWLNKRTGKWHAYIKKDGKRKHLGTHAFEEDAAAAYDVAALAIFGEFAKYNFPAKGRAA